MKGLHKLVVLAFALCAVAVSASAETKEKDTSNRDENGKIVRGPYATNNKFFDNSFVGFGWGMNMFSNKKNHVTARVTPTAVDVYLGKWFIPELGLRLAYTGVTGSENSTGTAEVETEGEKLLEKFGFAYLHGDVLWNISNTIGGYREDRFWSFVPYIHGGFLFLYNVTDDANKYTDFRRDTNSKDTEWCGGFGLLNLMHVHPRLNVTLDVRNMLFSGRFHNWDVGGICNGLTATIGLQVLLGKTRFDRTTDDSANKAALAEAAAALAAAKAALAQSEDENKALADANKGLTDSNDSLNDANKALADKLAKIKPIVDTVTVYLGSPEKESKWPLGIAPMRLYFKCGSSTLSATEKDHLRYYVETVLDKDPDRVFYFTGSTDKSTGSEEYNKKLGKERVENTIKLLQDEFGISKDRLQYRGNNISDANKDVTLDRSVLIEH